MGHKRVCQYIYLLKMIVKFAKTRNNIVPAVALTTYFWYSNLI